MFIAKLLAQLKLVFQIRGWRRLPMFWPPFFFLLSLPISNDDAGQMLPVATQYAGLSCADAQRFFQEKRRLDQTGEVREFISPLD